MILLEEVGKLVIVMPGEVERETLLAIINKIN